MSLSGIRPDGQVGHGIELLEKTTNYLVSVIAGAQSIEVGHYPGERRLRLTDGALGITLALLIEASLALDEFFSVERGQGLNHRLARRRRVGQKPGHALSRCQHIGSTPQSSDRPARVSTPARATALAKRMALSSVARRTVAGERHDSVVPSGQHAPTRRPYAVPSSSRLSNVLISFGLPFPPLAFMT